MRIITLYVFSVLLGMKLSAQTPEVYPLWPGGAKESNGIKAQESVDAAGRVSNISVAQFSVYKPLAEKNTGMAVVICPGGGYGIVAQKHEGEQFAVWLAARGITGIVLKYRLPNQHHRIPLADAQRCIQVVRSRAEEWAILPDKIGIAGFSAGGHLASTAGTHFKKANNAAEDRFERYSSRPDFMILFYPVISFSEEYGHKGSRYSLIGSNASQELVDLYSNEKHVTAQTPPTFLIHCDDDEGVSSLNSVVFYQKLKSKHVPSVLYIFDKGGHGWGMNPDFAYYKEWTDLLDGWLKRLRADK